MTGGKGQPMNPNRQPESHTAAARWTVVAYAVIVALTVPTVGAGQSLDEIAARKFGSFCVDWMEKLAIRERDNRTTVRWEAGPTGVSGEYVGYSADHSCELKRTTEGVLIGKVNYREFVYQQQGASVQEAHNSALRIVDTTQVLELFRYDGSRWVY